MNYQELSDFELGVEVCKVNFPNADFIGKDAIGYPPSVFYGSDSAKEMYRKANPQRFSESRVLVLHGDWAKTFDLNNTSDAWPIIVENKITLQAPDSGFTNNSETDWDASCSLNGMCYSSSDKIALRAAMICFLQMKEGESQ